VKIKKNWYVAAASATFSYTKITLRDDLTANATLYWQLCVTLIVLSIYSGFHVR